MKPPGESISQIHKIKIGVLANLYTGKKKCPKSQSIPIFAANFLLIMLINCVFPENIGKSHKIQGLITNALLSNSATISFNRTISFFETTQNSIFFSWSEYIPLASRLVTPLPICSMMASAISR